MVRGQVVTPNGMGLIGVRVSTNGANEGFTMTRQDGWFDLMVNGGGPVMLQFGRNPYSPLRLALNVPWNEVMVLAPVKLTDKEVHVQVPELYQSVDTCTDHDYDTMKSVLSLANTAIEISPHGVSSCAECETEIQVKPRKRACCSLFRGIFCGKKTGPESTTIEGAAHAKLQHLAKKLKQLIFTG